MDCSPRVQLVAEQRRKVLGVGHRDVTDVCTHHAIPDHARALVAVAEPSPDVHEVDAGLSRHLALDPVGLDLASRGGEGAGLQGRVRALQAIKWIPAHPRGVGDISSRMQRGFRSATACCRAGSQPSPPSHPFTMIRSGLISAVVAHLLDHGKELPARVPGHPRDGGQPRHGVAVPEQHDLPRALGVVVLADLALGPLVSAGITDFVRSCRMWSKDGSRLLGIGSACCAARTAAFTPAGQRIGDIPTKRRGWRPRRWLAPQLGAPMPPARTAHVASTGSIAAEPGRGAVLSYATDVMPIPAKPAQVRAERTVSGRQVTAGRSRGGHRRPVPGAGERGEICGGRVRSVAVCRIDSSNEAVPPTASTSAMRTRGTGPGVAAGRLAPPRRATQYRQTDHGERQHGRPDQGDGSSTASDQKCCSSETAASLR